MQSDYYNSLPRSFSIQAMQNLADEWFEASKNNLSSNKAQDLYLTTWQAITYIDKLEAELDFATNSECIPIAAKLADLSKAFMSGFKKHGVDDSIDLAFWVSEHTGLDREKVLPQIQYGRIYKYQGAYDTLHNLVKQIELIKESYTNNPLDLRDISNLKLVDSASEVFIDLWRKTEIPQPSDVKSVILEKTGNLEEILAMRATSKENKNIVDSVLIKWLNDKALDFEDLNIRGFEDIFYFFGDQSSKLMHLNMCIDSKCDDQYIAMITQRYPNIESVTVRGEAEILPELIECLSKLKRLKFLTFEKFNDNKAFNGIVKSCLYLENIILKNCEGIQYISTLDTCKNLKILSIEDCPNISADLTFNKCPLQFVQMKNCSIENLACQSITTLYFDKCSLKSIVCPKLTEIAIQNTVIYDSKILQNLSLLKDLALISCDIEDLNLENSLDLKNITIRNCSFKDLYFLSKLSSLTTLIIENCPISSINALEFLPALETFEMKGCKEMTDIEVLKYCKKLKTVILDKLPENNTQAVIDYNKILKELHNRGIQVILK